MTKDYAHFTPQDWKSQFVSEAKRTVEKRAKKVAWKTAVVAFAIILFNIPASTLSPFSAGIASLFMTPIAIIYGFWALWDAHYLVSAVRRYRELEKSPLEDFP